MKFPMLQITAILCILAVGFMTVEPFVPTADAHNYTVVTHYYKPICAPVAVAKSTANTWDPRQSRYLIVGLGATSRIKSSFMSPRFGNSVVMTVDELPCAGAHPS